MLMIDKNHGLLVPDPVDTVSSQVCAYRRPKWNLHQCIDHETEPREHKQEIKRIMSAESL